MSDEQRKDETRSRATPVARPSTARTTRRPRDEVEGHGYPPKYGAGDETAEDEVEGHVHRRS